MPVSRLRRMLALGTVAVALAASQLALTPGSGAAAPERQGPVPRAGLAEERQHPLPLTLRGRWELHGGITRIANTLMTCDEKKAPLVKGAASCLDARKGVGDLIYNNNYPMKYVDQYPGTYKKTGEKIYSSSSADLNLIPGSTVKYARLYWGGTRGIKDVILPISQVDGVLFKAPDGKDYHEVDAGLKDIGWMTGLAAGEHGYQASADVTDIVRRAGNGRYTVANMDSVVQHHSWGGWTLVVVYENCDKPYRDFHLWDGFLIELPESPPITVDVDGLDVPDQGPVDARLGWITYDGDRTYRHDTVQIKSTNGPLTLLSAPDNPADDIMNSTIFDDAGTDVSKRSPRYENQFGFDSDRFDISKYVRNGDHDLQFVFNTHEDGYQIGAIYSSVNLNQP